MKPAILATTLLLASVVLFNPRSETWADEVMFVKSDAPGKLYEVETFTDIRYFAGLDADKAMHELDFYRPKGQKDFPVLIFVHGGSWRHGDKNKPHAMMGGYRYSTLGKFFASHGIGTVVTNYRLSPGVKHPEHIKDVARAFAWTHKNIAQFGGRPDQIFLCGHSAGGHLIALLGTDDNYLKVEGLTLKDIKGVIPISGVFQEPDMPPRDLKGVIPTGGVFQVPGVLWCKDEFGTDLEARKQAFPMAHCHPGCPPFLIIYAQTDLPYCGKKPATNFCKALKEEFCDAETLEIKLRNHITVLTRASEEKDPTSRAVLDFISAKIK